MGDVIGLGMIMLGGVLIWVAWKSVGTDPWQMFQWFFQEISQSGSNKKASTAST